MKQISLVLALLFITNTIFSQTINWANFNKQQKNIITINAGLEYGLVKGLGYSYKLKSKLPLLVQAEYSSPSGKTFFDDFKTKTGVQVEWYRCHHFFVTTRLQGIFRRYQNDFARLLNFGSDVAATTGYYKHKWFLAVEAGFDKAIVTHFKHSSVFKQNFPGIKDGWYEPATGGNFYYGVQAGYSFKKQDIYLKAGKTVSQDFKTTSLIPFYAQLGYNIGF